MEILKFTLTLLVIYHSTGIIAQSSFPLCKWLRDLPGWLGHFFSCFLCVSVWVGFVYSYFLFNPSAYIGYSSGGIFVSGILYSCLAWFLYLIEGKLN